MITIIISTYNGEKYLKNQLNSLFLQTFKNFQVLVRDDGSSDNTLEVLKSYDIKLIKTSKNLGAKESFSELLNYAVANSNSEYFMFCDQDDVWYSDKVEKTLLKIQAMEQECGDIGLLVHTDLEVVDEKLNILNNSFMDFQKIDPMKNNFNNLLIQNTITGCTMLINRKLAQKCLSIPDSAIMHDWWIGLVACQFGNIGYVNEATMKYRQHTSNAIGAKGFDISFILKNMSKKISLAENIFQAKAFLDRYRDKLDKNTIEMLEDFSTIESKSFWQKRKILLKHKLLKQGLIRNIGLLVKI